MKNKKGFTLIELLAVIVILAIIALIAVPIVLNMIENARKSAAKSSAYGYIDAINNNNELASMKNNNMENIPDTISDGTYDVAEINIKIKGKKPTSGEVTITNGRVASADLCINNYMVNYNNNEATVGDKCSGGGSSTTYTAYQVGDAINFDPTTNKLCTTPVSTTGTKTGCMKWYVIATSGANNSTFDVILDHNTTAKVAYETSGTYKAYEQASIKNQVDTDATGWASGLNPRLITTQEVVNITNTTTFNGSGSTWFYFDGTGTNKQTQVSSTQGTSPYKWLFDYTDSCTSYGCNTADSNVKGYWTSSPVSDYSYTAWTVNSRGSLSYNSVANVDYSGVRPVITIDKSQLQ